MPKQRGRPTGSTDKEKRKKKDKGTTHFFATFQKFVKVELADYLEKYELISAFVICNETGWGEHEHSHAYLQTNEPCTLNKMRELLLSEDPDFNLGDLQACKSPKSTIIYCSKEDMDVKLKNIDRERLHIDWKINHAANTAKVLSEQNYCVRAIPPNYRPKLQALHDEIWNEKNCDLHKLSALEHCHTHSQTLCNILNSDKKGIWIYGDTGTGKTSAALTCLVSPFCRFLGDCYRFPLNNYKGEDDILFDECAHNGYDKHREIILKLTGGFGAECDRKNNSHFTINLTGKLYITSNFPPPIEPEFLRRFDVFHFIK